MITRIVKMEFDPDKIEDFKLVFEEVKQKISEFEGCEGVSLLQDVKNKNIFFTYSHWESEEALNNYRHSEFFAQTWKKTKALFTGKPQAWSTNVIA